MVTHKFLSLLAFLKSDLFVQNIGKVCLVALTFNIPLRCGKKTPKTTVDQNSRQNSTTEISSSKMLKN